MYNMTRCRVLRGLCFSPIMAFAALFTILLTMTPSTSFGQGNQFFYCTDKEGNVTITNRHYDQKLYTCTPFSNLNRAFKEAESAEKRRPAPVAAKAEGISSEEAVRMSADSARTSMEAAQAAAQAAYITAEAVQRMLARQYYVIIP